MAQRKTQPVKTEKAGTVRMTGAPDDERQRERDRERGRIHDPSTDIGIIDAKPNIDKGPKDIGDLSIKDLKGRVDSMDERIQAATKAGDATLVGQLQERKQELKRQIQANKVGGVGEMDFQQTLDFIKNDPRYKLLSPDQKQAIEKIVQSYDYSGVLSSELTKKELKALANFAAKSVDPYYDQKKKDIDTEYEVGLSDSLDDLKTGLERSQADLQKALDEGDSYKAEQIKKTQADMQGAIAYYTQERDEYVKFKRSYLEQQISAAKAGVEEGIGRANEDELRNLRGQERQYKNQLTNLQDSMQQRGYAWADDRTKDETTLGEENVDIMSAISSVSKRQKMDVARAMEDQFGSEALKGIAGVSEYLRGGVTGTTAAASEYDIADALARYQENVRGQVSTAEGLLGSEAIAAMGYTGTGGLEGDINRTYRTGRDTAVTNYGRYVEDATNLAARTYGTDAVAGAVGGSVGALDGVYAGYEVPTGTGYKYGSAGRQYRQDLRENKYARTAAEQAIYDQEVAARQSNYQY